MRKRNDIEYEIGARPTIESATNSIIIQWNANGAHNRKS